MPFNADTRCGVFNIELNVGIISEELEAMLDKTYMADTDEGSLFWKYVYHLEIAFTNACNSNNSRLDFWEWFVDNYGDMDLWDAIELNFRIEE
jgi:hypothetical protein